jgi:hypothetical protein
MGRFDFRTRKGLIFDIIQNSPAIDVDALNFFNRVTAAGGTLSQTERNAINILVFNLKAQGLWSSMKAIYPMVGSTAAACAQNLVSSNFTGLFSGGWTFSSMGVTGNGINSYMNTGCTPTQMGQNSCHLSIYNRTNSGGAFVDVGCTTSSNTGNDFQVVSRFTGDVNYSMINGSNVSGFAQSISSGLQLISRIVSTGFNYFSNTTKTAVTKVSIAPNNLNVYIGARNVNNLTIDFSTNRQCAFASIGDGLTDTQASDFYTAVQTFQTTLSRQV